MARTVNAASRIVNAVDRTVNASVRTNDPIYRLPVTFVSDLGVTNYWDFATGFTGTNDTAASDRVGVLTTDFVGATAIGSVYTPGEYSAQLVPANDDAFGTSGDVRLSASAITNISGIHWIKRDSTGTRHAAISHFSSVVPTQRSFFVRTQDNGGIEVILSSDGSAQNFIKSSETPADTLNWQALGWSFSASSLTMYHNGLALTIESGVVPAQIFNVATKLCLGAFINAAGNPASELKGKLGISVLASGTTWTNEQMLQMFNLTKSLGGYSI